MRAVSASTDPKCVRSSMSAAAAMWDSPGCISRTIPEIYRCGVVPQRALPGVLADELEVARLERPRGARAGQVGAEEQRGRVDGGDRAQGAPGRRGRTRRSGSPSRARPARPGAACVASAASGPPRWSITSLDAAAAAAGRACRRRPRGASRRARRSGGRGRARSFGVGAAREVGPEGAHAGGVEAQDLLVGDAGRDLRDADEPSGRGAAARRSGTSGRRPGRSRTRPRRRRR